MNTPTELDGCTDVVDDGDVVVDGCVVVDDVAGAVDDVAGSIVVVVAGGIVVVTVGVDGTLVPAERCRRSGPPVVHPTASTMRSVVVPFHDQYCRQTDPAFFDSLTSDTFDL
jgi:hypothetical protein